MNEFQLKKVWKGAIALSVITAIELGSGRSIANPQLEIHATIGYTDGTSAVVYDALTVGRDWAAFSLTTKKFIGISSVKESGGIKQGNCSFSAKKDDFVFRSFLTMPNRQAQGGKTLFIRPIPTAPASVKIKSVLFSQLPQSLQRQLLDSHEYRYGGWKRNLAANEFMSIDLDNDGSTDLIYTRLLSSGADRESIHIKLDSKWVEKYWMYCVPNGE